MEMTLRRLGLNQVSPILKNMGLPLAILMLVAMMVLPLPSILLDIFFTSNILLSLLILMVAMNAFRPLEFSSFPTILLFATILRLGLNVASTRVVLSEGHTGTDAAGKVIEAFGAFVVAGNYVVGIFVFIILVIINLSCLLFVDVNLGNHMSGLKSSWELSLKRSDKLVPELKNKKKITDKQKKTIENIYNKKLNYSRHNEYFKIIYGFIREKMVRTS